MESTATPDENSASYILAQKVKLIKSIGECVEEEGLVKLLQSGKKVVCYNGFEPSGRLTFGQCMMAVINVNKLVQCECYFKFWVADWFAQINNKLGGDLKKIQKAGKLMIEIWKSAGMQMENSKGEKCVEFVWASEEINRRSHEYWPIVMDIMSKFTITHMKGTMPALGREVKEEENEDEIEKELKYLKQTDSVPSSTLLYAAMQCADIFFLKIDICQLGLDQRKVNMLAREYCDKIGKKFKPIILSHNMLMGLDGRIKMSKSDPDNAIFMDDLPVEIRRKINKAYCEPENIKVNPLLEYLKHIIFEIYPIFQVKRTQEHGGDVTYTRYIDVERDFAVGLLHPGDLKEAVLVYILNILEPVNRHFTENK